MKTRALLSFAPFAIVTGACLSIGTGPLGAQGVVVDEGTFVISLSGRRVGTEEFVIRRAGLGRGDAVFANGVVHLDLEGQVQETRSLLRATAADGVVEGYQVTVTGVDALGARLARVAGRYVATLRSPEGEEDREFQARSDTRVLERGVAHHYYFVRDLREGRPAHVLEPRGRLQYELVAGPRVDEELRVGRDVVQARRVEFSADGDVRSVWYDRQGRVLRVEIGSRQYVAERSDVVR